MRRVAWRAVLVAICALTAIAQVADVVDAIGMGGAPPWGGWWGAAFGVSSHPFNIAVTAVDPGGPAARASLRRNDLIDIRANTLVERFSLLGAPLNGRPVVLSVHRGSLQKKLTVVPHPRKATWDFWLFAFGNLWLLLFAALIAWRRADMPQMRLLSLWLAVFALGGATGEAFAAPWAWVYVLFNISSAVAGPLSVALLAAFAGCFAQPLSRFRRIAQWLCYTVVAIATATVCSWDCRSYHDAIRSAPDRPWDRGVRRCCGRYPDGRGLRRPGNCRISRRRASASGLDAHTY